MNATTEDVSHATALQRGMMITTGDFYALQIFADVIEENIQTAETRSEYLRLLLEKIQIQNTSSPTETYCSDIYPPTICQGSLSENRKGQRSWA